MKYLLPFLLLSTHGPTPDQPVDVALVFGPPTQSASWDEVPTITICSGAPVKKDRVEKAVKFWEDLGYDLGEVTLADRDDFSCARDIVFRGEIVISLVGQSFNIEGGHLATTRTWYNAESRTLLKAKIEIMNGWGQSERLMEHELGHALGWRDYNQIGHIMHSEWSLGGHRTKGLEQQ